MPTAGLTRPLLTIPQTARRLAVSEKTVRRLIDAEVLPALRVSARTVRVDPDELEQWLYEDAGGSSAYSRPSVEPAERSALEKESAFEGAPPLAGEGVG